MALPLEATITETIEYALIPETIVGSRLLGGTQQIAPMKRFIPHIKATAAGEHVAGVYRQRLTLTSGRFAMIDNGLGFQLVAGSPPLESKLGQHIAAARFQTS